MMTNDQVELLVKSFEEVLNEFRSKLLLHLSEFGNYKVGYMMNSNAKSLQIYPGDFRLIIDLHARKAWHLSSDLEIGLIKNINNPSKNVATVHVLRAELKSDVQKFVVAFLKSQGFTVTVI